MTLTPKPAPGPGTLGIIDATGNFVPVATTLYQKFTMPELREMLAHVPDAELESLHAHRIRAELSFRRFHPQFFENEVPR